MTRAKSELLMTWRQTVPMFSSGGFKTVDRPRSRFLDVLVAKKPQPSSALSTEISVTPQPKKWSEKYKTTQNSMTPKQKNWSEKYRAMKDKADQIKAWSPSSKFGTLPAAKFSGTASVYASNTNTGKFIDIKAEKLSTKSVSPQRPSAPIKARSTFNSVDQNVARSVQSRLANDSISLQASSSAYSSDGSPSKPNAAQRNQQQSIDSSWFFPIGSKVRHKIFGEGVVVTPQTTSSLGSMSVLVEFKNGEQQEFPVQTTELSPIIVT